MRTQRQPVRTLDKLDRRILKLLQNDGRISMKDLAEQVGLTVTPCIERVRRMERDGVITGYTRASIRACSARRCWCSSRSRSATRAATCSSSSAAKC
jgi:predicted transcriptional regulator